MHPYLAYRIGQARLAELRRQTPNKPPTPTHRTNSPR